MHHVPLQAATSATANTTTTNTYACYCHCHHCYYFCIQEVTGVYPLRYMAEVAYGGANADNWSGLLTEKGQKFVIVGGKGGVGKVISDVNCCYV
jgi:hypothetical protein